MILAAMKKKDSQKRNKTIDEIFAENNLSNRFYHYQRDKTEKGQAMYVCHILLQLKKEFPECRKGLNKAILIERKRVITSQEIRIKWVIKSLENYASTIWDIAHDTGLSPHDVNKYLKELLKIKKVRYTKNPNKTSWQDSRFWFLETNVTQ